MSVLAMADLTEEDVLTPPQVAKLLAVCTRTIVRMAERGELPAFKVGRLWRFRRSELNDKLIANQKFGTPQAT